MSKKRFAVCALVLALVLAGGGLFASNMGFKLNYQLLSAANPSSATGTNTIALPFIQQVGLSDAKSLIDDIGSSAVVNVQRYLEDTNSIETYTGTAGTAFNLEGGTGYFVVVNTDTSYVIVGSHDPDLEIDLDAASEPDNATGTNLIAYAYHATVADAKGLIDEIGSTNVVNVQRYLEDTNSIETYTGTAGVAFALAPGEAYYIVVNTTVAWKPSHF